MAAASAASEAVAAVVLASRARAARQTQVRVRLLTFLVVVVGASAASGGSYSDSSLGRYEGPSFSQEPPHLVEFSNSTGSQVMCRARGNPEPKVTWLLADGSPLSSLSGVRHVTSDGTLVFPPFRAEEYRQDVHAVVYLCAASNSAGTVVSRDVKVKAVVVQPYEVYVYDVYTIRGNSAVMKCHVPNFLQDYVTVTSWVRDGAFAIPTANVEENGKYVVLAGGHLVVNHVGAEDAGNSFRCQTQHRLTGETRISLTAGKLYVTDPQGSVPPRISASEISVTGKEGETAVIPCVTQGYPAPTTTWYTQVSQGHLLPLQPLARGSRFSVKSSALVARDLRPEDSGVYVCEASNNMGTERVYTRLTVTTALRVEVKPSAITADIGRTVSFQCVTSGLPAPTITWLKDGTPLPAENVNFQEVHTLTIRSVTAAQRGMYQCLAKNDVASAQGIAELKLGDTPPELISTFQDQTLRPGSSIHLRCEASGTPPPQIIWTLDGKAVARQRTQDLVDGVVISWLNVTSVAIEDGGVYSCRATSKAGTSVHSARINIYGRLAARTRPPLKAIAERSAILHCPLIGYPWDSVTWEKDGFILPVNHRQNVLKNGTLLIERVRRSADGGKYYCTATNKQDDVSVRAEVEVTVMVPPKILPFAFQDDQFFKGMRAHIICAVSQGDLPLHFHWLKDGQVIGPKLGVVARDIDGHANSLSIERVSSDHTGNYTCVVDNSAARVTHTAQLLIYDDMETPKIMFLKN